MLQAYVCYEGEAFEKPLCSLKHFDRIPLASGEKRAYTCVLPKKRFESVLEERRTQRAPGRLYDWIFLLRAKKKSLPKQ